MRHSAQQSGVQVALELTEPMPELWCDAEQIRQVLLNLALNGVQAMSQGGTLEISAVANGREIEVQVSDEGGGIAPEHIAKLFDPFFTTRTDGTGLGLSIAQQIVTQHGGTVEVDSTGLRHHVYGQASIPAQWGTVNRRILVVEDEESLRRVMEVTLARGGYRIETAPNAERAVSKLDHDPFDLVITDLQMPGIRASTCYGTSVRTIRTRRYC
jgi:signal transduction histidine kinase